jgi:hypothetical protein
MAIREFDDEAGRRWTVWDVHPALVDRRMQDTGPPLGIRERRLGARRRAIIPPNMAQGWLAFETHDGERRRLAPIPDVPKGWAAAPDAELRAWCAKAQRVTSSRRLIE